VKLNRKAVLTLAVASLVWLVAGCGGISSSQSVSPATFLLPGLLKAEPRPADPNITVPAQPENVLLVQAQ
jgi:hypothetical protein